MLATPKVLELPSLPQHANAEQSQQRKFQLSLARTSYNYMRSYPPLDVSLYTFSFECLLSGVQYDTFGHYESNPRTPYFTASVSDRRDRRERGD